MHASSSTNSCVPKRISRRRLTVASLPSDDDDLTSLLPAASGRHELSRGRRKASEWTLGLSIGQRPCNDGRPSPLAQRWRLAADPLAQQRFLRFVGIRWPEPNCDRHVPMGARQCSGSDLKGDVERALKAKDAASSRWQRFGDSRRYQQKAGELVAPLLLSARPPANSTWSLSFAPLVEKGMPKLMANTKPQPVPSDRLSRRWIYSFTPPIGWFWIDPQVEKVATGVRTEVGLDRPSCADPLARDSTPEHLCQMPNVHTAIVCREPFSQRNGRLFRGLNQYCSNIENTRRP